MQIKLIWYPPNVDGIIYPRSIFIKVHILYKIAETSQDFCKYVGYNMQI